MKPHKKHYICFSILTKYLYNWGFHLKMLQKMFNGRKQLICVLNNNIKLIDYLGNRNNTPRSESLDFLVFYKGF